jgi:hypothetical protein
VNSLTIGKGRANIATNTALGYQVLYSTNSGDIRNTGIGYQSLYNCTNDDNTAIGYQSLYNSNEGRFNTAVGSLALNTIVGGTNNVGIGYNSGTININSGSSYNTFLGADTGAGSAGTYNYSTAIGYGALIDTNNQIVLGRTSEMTTIPGTFQKSTSIIGATTTIGNRPSNIYFFGNTATSISVTMPTTIPDNNSGVEIIFRRLIGATGVVTFLGTANNLIQSNTLTAGNSIGLANNAYEYKFVSYYDTALKWYGMGL